ncbi:MAG: hybrid sensor histidine kinase/response regulator [Microcoleaceae cyanobacterium]
MNNTNNQKIILIVDDNPANLGTLFKFLTDLNFKVLVATDGESAIEQINYLRPDIVLLDVMMPGIDGFETCRRLKINPDTIDIPVIFLTALSETVDKVRGFSLGGVDYITKPVQYEEVLVRVKTHLTISDLQQQLKQKNNELSDLNQHLEKLVEAKTKELITQEKSAMIGRLTQGMVHNLRNPLQTILLSSTLIQAEAEDIEQESILEDIQYIQTAGNRIQEMLDNLSHRSSMDRHEELQLLNLNLIIQEEIKLLGANYQFKHKVKKEIVLADDLPEIGLIYTNISQIFHNLINNALDAMWHNTEQKMAIITRQDENYVYLDVKDSGCGIPPQEINKIFEIFYTSKPAKEINKQSEEPTGTGLGLFTCIELLKPLGGEMKVDSKVGEGTTFTVVLPKTNTDTLLADNLSS